MSVFFFLAVDVLLCTLLSGGLEDFYSVHLCMYVCMYVCLCVCVCMYVCWHVYTSEDADVLVCVYVCLRRIINMKVCVIFSV